jgi:hypothetical protein
MTLTLAKVPLAITSSFPLLAPYELKSFYSTPLAIKYLPAGEFLVMFPAGEIWSVVIESPKEAKQYASVISLISGRDFSTLLKKGGSWI